MAMDSPPTLWNIDDKSDYLSVEPDGLKVIYKGVISLQYSSWDVTYVICISFLNLRSR